MLKKKRFLLIMCAAIFLLSGSVVAFGYGDPYYFILRGTDKEDTVPHAKMIMNRWHMFQQLVHRDLYRERMSLDAE